MVKTDEMSEAEDTMKASQVTESANIWVNKTE